MAPLTKLQPQTSAWSCLTAMTRHRQAKTAAFRPAARSPRTPRAHIHTGTERVHRGKSSSLVVRIADGAIDQAAISHIRMDLSDLDETPSTSENGGASAGNTLAPNNTRALSCWARQSSPGHKLIAGGQNRRPAPRSAHARAQNAARKGGPAINSTYVHTHA